MRFTPGLQSISAQPRPRASAARTPRSQRSERITGQPRLHQGRSTLAACPLFRHRQRSRAPRLPSSSFMREPNTLDAGQISTRYDFVTARAQISHEADLEVLAVTH